MNINPVPLKPATQKWEIELTEAERLKLTYEWGALQDKPFPFTLELLDKITRIQGV